MTEFREADEDTLAADPEADETVPDVRNDEVPVHADDPQPTEEA